uniref:Uncharacterized protein n=1 Tax=Lepeophtheirus salmonis TaxID=72036 RepID=A0A0K2UTM2_LEPSM
MGHIRGMCDHVEIQLSIFYHGTNRVPENFYKFG